MLLELSFLFFSTLCLAFGLVSNGLILYYLKSKNELHTTAFDRSMMDSIWSVIFAGFTTFCGATLVLIPSKVTNGIILMYTIVQVFSRINLACSTFVTILIKLGYIKHPGFMLETSDEIIYGVSLMMKVILILFVFLLNHLVPYKSIPIEHLVLSNEPVEDLK